MQAELAGRKLIMVLLDSAGTYTRIADAERLRHWLTGDASPATFVMPPT
jgi:D-alanyl-D-alanine endopeptidase (penicillin-binding protein 7)